MSHKSRLAKLETAAGVGKRNGYLCVISAGWAAAWDTPEETAKGYKIQPYTVSAGGTGGEPFYLATEAELNEFAARPDVNLHIIEIGYVDASEQAAKDEISC